MYNPFGKQPDEIKQEDFQKTLPGKKETWVFEYKGPRKIDDRAGIARSIASFANKYGGWLFIGIDADKETNEPDLEDISGIPPREQLTESIYQICNSHLSPAPYIVSHAVELENGNCVLVIYVPESADPPHVHIQTGTIFVRSGNVTDPIDRIKDRAELDGLYDKALRNEQELQKLLQRHQEGMSLAEYQCARNRRAPHEDFPEGLARGYAYAVCYPLSAAFRIPDLFRSQQQPLEPLTSTIPVLQEYLEKRYAIVPPSYPDQHTIRYVTSTGVYALQMDVYGHFIECHLREIKPHSNYIQKLVPQFASIWSDVYRGLGYWGRVGLIVHVGRILWREAHEPAGLRTGARVQRLVAAPQLSQLRMNDLEEEAARALGEWDQP